MKKNNQLDERQEQILLKIEHNACWVAFWALLTAIIVQQFIFGIDFRFIAGEWITFMVVALYLFGACMKNGIWDRHLKPNAKTNFLVSLIASVLFGVVMFFLFKQMFPDKSTGPILGAVLCAVLVFVMCFGILSASAAALKKKQRKMEEETEEEL